MSWLHRSKKRADVNGRYGSVQLVRILLLVAVCDTFQHTVITVLDVSLLRGPPIVAVRD